MKIKLRKIWMNRAYNQIKLQFDNKLEIIGILEHKIKVFLRSVFKDSENKSKIIMINELDFIIFLIYLS